MAEGQRAREGCDHCLPPPSLAGTTSHPVQILAFGGFNVITAGGRPAHAGVFMASHARQIAERVPVDALQHMKGGLQSFELAGVEDANDMRRRRQIAAKMQSAVYVLNDVSALAQPIDLYRDQLGPARILGI